MGSATDPPAASASWVELRAARRRIIARQRALRPQIREAKLRGDHDHARRFHEELRELRAQLRRLLAEERARRGQHGSG